MFARNKVEEKLTVQDKHYRSNNLKVPGLTGNIQFHEKKKRKSLLPSLRTNSVDIEQKTEITPMRMPREGPVIFSQMSGSETYAMTDGVVHLYGTR